MIWRAADGHIVKTIGNVTAANTVVPVPAPGPSTALSRAAERDPATPNPVWTTPRVGYPYTRYRIHFHVLLNGAQYVYLLTREGKQLTINEELHCTPWRSVSPIEGTLKNYGVAAGNHPNVVRGNTWSDVLTLGDDPRDPSPLCPGTYRVSVAVANRGILDRHPTYAGELPSPYPFKPFGTAVFTVRPAPRSHVVVYLLAGLAAAAAAITFSIARRRRNRT
jgi:hypothetical protein